MRVASSSSRLLLTLTIRHDLSFPSGVLKWYKPQQLCNWSVCWKRKKEKKSWQKIPPKKIYNRTQDRLTLTLVCVLSPHFSRLIHTPTMSCLPLPLILTTMIQAFPRGERSGWIVPPSPSPLLTLGWDFLIFCVHRPPARRAKSADCARIVDKIFLPLFRVQ